MEETNEEMERHQHAVDSLVEELIEINNNCWFINSHGDKKKLNEMTDDEIDGREWEQATFSHYLDDALDIEIRVGLDGDYRSAYICLGTGGPELGIDTGTGEAICYGWFGLNKATKNIPSEVVNAIDDTIEDLMRF